jgi:hypothetical protein
LTRLADSPLNQGIEQDVPGTKKLCSIRNLYVAGDTYQLLVEYEWRVVTIPDRDALHASQVQQRHRRGAKMPDGKMVVFANGSSTSRPCSLEEALNEQGLEPSLVGGIAQLARSA